MKIECPNCGSNLTFSPTIQKCVCEHCNQQIDLEDNTFSMKKVDFEKYKNYYNCTCSSCGAELITNENDLITTCLYCGSKEVITSRLKGNFAPQKIIPFKIAKENIIKEYKNFIARQSFVPKEFKKEPRISDIKAVYVPYFIKKYKAKEDIRGKNIYGYFEESNLLKITILHDAKQNLKDDFMQKIEPFFLKEHLKDFNIGYLAGYYAEKTDENYNSIDRKSISVISDYLTKGFVYYRNMYNNKVELRDNFKGKLFVDLKDDECYCILVPVYFFYIVYGNLKYFQLANGQTGKFAGTIPSYFNNKKVESMYKTRDYLKYINNFNDSIENFSQNDNLYRTINISIEKKENEKKYTKKEYLDKYNKGELRFYKFSLSKDGLPLIYLTNGKTISECISNKTVDKIHKKFLKKKEI